MEPDKIHHRRFHARSGPFKCIDEFDNIPGANILRRQHACDWILRNCRREILRNALRPTGTGTSHFKQQCDTGEDGTSKNGPRHFGCSSTRLRLSSRKRELSLRPRKTAEPIASALRGCGACWQSYTDFTRLADISQLSRLGRVCKVGLDRGNTGLSPVGHRTRLAEEPSNGLRSWTTAGPLQRSSSLQTRPSKPCLWVSSIPQMGYRSGGSGEQIMLRWGC